jgi:glycogen synthase
MLDALYQCYRRLPPAQVIYNGRCATHFRAAPKEPFVLSAGRLWDEAKNLSALNEIAERLPWPVRVAGETSSDSTSARAPAGNVVPLGRLTETELAGQMSRAAIYALPARYEPFGLSALEAAMSGCALVLGNIRSLREIWDDTAIYVPPDDPDAILGVLRRLTEAPLMRLHMARRAALRARRYTAQRMAREYLHLYRQMTGVEQPAVGGALELMKG